MKMLRNHNEKILKLFYQYRDKADYNAFSKLIKLLEPHLIRLMKLKSINDYDLQQEFLQISWIKLDRHKDEYQPEVSSLVTWVFSRFTLGSILHYYRTQKKAVQKVEHYDSSYVDNYQAFQQDENYVSYTNENFCRPFNLNVDTLQNYLPSDTFDQEKKLILKEKYKLLHKAIFALGKGKSPASYPYNENPYQDVILLHWFAGFSLEYIANLMGCPFPTVRTWHSRAKKMLKNILEKLNFLETEF